MNQPFHPAQMPMLTTDKTKTLQDIVGRWRAGDAEKIAFVPTMGALHNGHLSLVRLAKEKADKVVVSIFVNPTQFAPHEDFDTYPRDIAKDLKLLQTEGVDLVYTPSEAEIYPAGKTITTRAGQAAQGLESDFRPHFFDGVATVVHNLFKQVQPDIAIFGEKDFQQLQVIGEMVKAQSLPIEIIGAPIARDDYGLALSSRNTYLSADELEIARMLNQAIYKAAFDISFLPSSRWHAEGVGTNGIQNSQRVQPADIVDPRCLSPAAQDRGDDVEGILDEAAQSLLTCGFDKVDYVTFKPEWNRVLAAAWLGKTRLIDNCTVEKSA
jgi:pantoate--beta-alanine ligase